MGIPDACDVTHGLQWTATLNRLCPHKTRLREPNAAEWHSSSSSPYSRVMPTSENKLLVDKVIELGKHVERGFSALTEVITRVAVALEVSNARAREQNAKPKAPPYE